MNLDLSDTHFIREYGISIEPVTVKQEHSPKNLPGEELVLIIPPTRGPGPDWQFKEGKFLCLSHVHVLGLNAVLEISQSIR